MTRLLLTRPQQDSESLADKLSKYDIECVIEPMLTIAPTVSAKTDILPLLDPTPQAIILTSKHALEVFEDLSFIADIPTFASGARTGEYAREMGMKNVTVTGEKVSELADYVATHLKPEKEHILYLSGADITTDLQDVLHDYKINRLITYGADLAESFSPAAIKEITEEKLTGVVFFTQRSTAAFMSCIKKAGLEFNLKALRVYCLSDAVADTLSPTLFKSIAIAANPTVKSMIQLIVAKQKLKADKAPPVIDIELPVDKKTLKANAEKAQDTQPKPARGNGKWIAFLLLLQLGSTGYFAYQSSVISDFGEDHTGSWDKDLSHRLKALEERMNTIESDYAELKNQPARAGDDPSSENTQAEAGTAITQAEAESIHEQLGELTTRIAKAESTKTSESSLKEIQQLKEQIESMHTRIETEQKGKWQQIQLLASFDTLKKAIESGQPYANPLFAIRVTAETIPQAHDKLETLTTHQDKGVATLKQLQTQFEQAISSYMQQSDPHKDGVVDRVKHNLSKLVVVRKVGETHTGNDAQSRIARAEAALGKEQLEAAIAELDALNDPAAQSLNDWVAEAKAHLQVYAASDALYHDVVMTIGTEKQ